MESLIVEHICFEALDDFKEKKLKLPKEWDDKDAAEFVKFAEKVAEKLKIEDSEKKKLPRISKMFAY